MTEPYAPGMYGILSAPPIEDWNEAMRGFGED
jgi:hypothetical protein